MQLPGEPLWLAEDTEKAIAYELAQREACSACGHRRSDFEDDDGPLDPPLLMAEVQDCPGCAAKQLASMELQEDARSAAGDGEDAQTIAARALAGLSIALVPFRLPTADDEEVDL